MGTHGRKGEASLKETLKLLQYDVPSSLVGAGDSQAGSRAQHTPCCRANVTHWLCTRFNLTHAVDSTEPRQQVVSSTPQGLHSVLSGASAAEAPANRQMISCVKTQGVHVYGKAQAVSVFHFR